MADTKYQKELQFPDPTEPKFVFRAKDNLSDTAVKAYRQALLDAGYAADSPMVLSCDEHLERRQVWRDANPDKCKNPDF